MKRKVLRGRRKTMAKENGNQSVPLRVLISDGPTKGDSHRSNLSNRVVGLFDDYSKIRDVISDLEEGGFNSKKLSILAKGEYCGELSGELRGMALVWIPDFGSFVLAGPLAWEVAVALHRADGGDGGDALQTALSKVGLPNERVSEYEEEVRSDKCLLILEGSQEEIRWAHELMSSTACQTEMWNGQRENELTA
jgi:hypothetical protein